MSALKYKNNGQDIEAKKAIFLAEPIIFMSGNIILATYHQQKHELCLSGNSEASVQAALDIFSLI